MSRFATQITLSPRARYASTLPRRASMCPSPRFTTRQPLMHEAEQPAFFETTFMSQSLVETTKVEYEKDAVNAEESLWDFQVRRTMAQCPEFEKDLEVLTPRGIPRAP
eukprot:TRINITY_DN215_c0_g1_i11.p1 TRINITY_DN215_c0_g1~~TRINITY_DN215_c0_g1_i11.p1  ORF type:complete len:108 (-),score=6.62 TRINITY_DN215_c0_g1_i11:342-665(-)